MIADPNYLSHQIVTDGTSLFRIIDGRRIWLSDPPLDQLVEILADLQRIALAQQARHDAIPTNED